MSTARGAEETTVPALDDAASRTANVLKGRNRWLTLPSTFAVAMGSLVASVYVASAFDFPPGSERSFAIILVGVIIVTNVIGDLVQQASLTTLRQLGAGLIRPTPAALETAASEALRAPNTSFWIVMLGFAGASVITGGMWWLIARPSLSAAARLAWVGLMIAPLAAMMGHLVMLPRARAVMRLLVSAGLPVERLYTSVPPSFQLRPRLMIYALIAVVTPMVLVIDMSLYRAAALVAKVGQLEAAQASALVLAERNQGFEPLIVLAAIVFLIVIACAWLSGQALGIPMRELAKETERLAHGHYGAPTVVPSELELWAVARALSMMERQLVDSMRQLDATTLGITKTTQQLVTGGATQSQFLVDQTAGLERTTSTTDELARSAQHITSNAQNVSQLAKDTLDVSRAGQLSAESFASSMQQVRAANQAIADSVVRLNKRVQQVGKVVEFIDGIADKSDLLALNAELEGNKAGEVGRGFSLVAAEMRRLAESVMESTKEIGGLITEIRDSTNATVMATEAGVKATEAGTVLAQHVRDEFLQIVEFANQSSDAMGTISTATAQQHEGTDQLARVMADILHSTQAGSEAARSMSSTNEALVTLASELKGSLEKLQEKR